MSMTDHELPRGADSGHRSTVKRIGREWMHPADQDVEAYTHESTSVMLHRLRELEREWDLDQVLAVKASTLALVGLVLGLKVNRGWLYLTVGALTCLLQHSVRGWSPPLSILRRLGVRSRAEIDREKYRLLAALKER